MLDNLAVDFGYFYEQSITESKTTNTLNPPGAGPSDISVKTDTWQSIVYVGLTWFF